MNDYEDALRDAALAAVFAKGAELVASATRVEQEKILKAISEVALEVLELKEEEVSF